MKRIKDPDFNTLFEGTFAEERPTVLPTLEFHLQGQHPQETHGSWATGSDEPEDTGSEFHRPGPGELGPYDKHEAVFEAAEKLSGNHPFGARNTLDYYPDTQKEANRISRGFTETGLSDKTHLRDAALVMSAISQSALSTETLYRGASDIGRIADPKPGDTFDMPLGAVTPDRRTAEFYNPSTIIQISEPTPWIKTTGNAGIEEGIVSGRFTITDVDFEEDLRGNEVRIIHARQTSDFSSEAQATLDKNGWDFGPDLSASADTVLAHGNHDQSTHGNWAAGYEPDPDAPDEGEFVRENGVATRWRQSHRRLLVNAFHSWKGDPVDMNIHMRAARENEPQPSSGSGKKMRAEAEALLWELANNAKPNPVPLYRGEASRSQNITGWSESKRIANAFAKKNKGTVKTLPANSVKGIKTEDYIHSVLTTEEKEWLVDVNTVEVEFALLAHGTHDQSTHGNWATGQSDEGRGISVTPYDDEGREADRVSQLESHYGRKELAPEMGGVVWSFEGASQTITEAATDVLNGYDYDPNDRFIGYDRASHKTAQTILKTIEKESSDVTLYSGHRRFREDIDSYLEEGVSFPLVATSPDKRLAQQYAGEGSKGSPAVVFEFPKGSQAGFYQANEHIATGEYEVESHSWNEDQTKVTIKLRQTKRSKVPSEFKNFEDEEDDN